MTTLFLRRLSIYRVFAVGTLILATIAVAQPVRRRAVRPQPPNELLFIPDAGIRVDNATNPGVVSDSSGTVHLYYIDRLTNRETVMSSTDGGITFSNARTDFAGIPSAHALLMPDGRTWRTYQWDFGTRTLKSRSSLDGRTYVADAGDRYAPQPRDNGTFGVYSLFTDSTNRVVLLYLGDLMGLNNVRRAYSTDNGLTFTFDRGNILGDDAAGGGPNSYVDQKVIRLPDGRLRLFAMKQLTIYSFLSIDDGLTFSREEGARLERSAFTDNAPLTLNDPVILRLPDGRYRMYVAAALSNTHWVILSATTR